MHSDVSTQDDWWNRQYSPTRTVANAEQVLADYRERTRRARHALPQHAIHAYGPSEAERLEVFRPCAEERWPAVVFVHGGGWDSLGLDDSGFLAEGLADHGYATVAIDYGHAPEIPLETARSMISRGLNHVYDNADALGLDQQRLIVAATSAGAHLTALALADAALAQRLAGAILLSGIYDLQPLMRTYYRDLLTLTQARIEACSPARQRAMLATRIVLAVGGEEESEFLRQTQRMGEHLRAMGIDPAVHIVPGHDHFTLPDALTEPSTALTQALADLAKLQDAAGEHEHEETA